MAEIVIAMQPRVLETKTTRPQCFSQFAVGSWGSEDVFQNENGKNVLSSLKDPIIGTDVSDDRIIQAGK